MPSYRERREAGEFEPDKTAAQAVQEAADEEFGVDERPVEEITSDVPAPKPKRHGVKVTNAE